MRNFLIASLIVCLFGAGFFHFANARLCRLPIEYQIETLDSRFNLSVNEVKSAILAAESVWEAATGLDLFVYTGAPGAFPINFVFDERQKKTNEEAKIKKDLEQAEQINNTINNRYTSLVNQFNALKARFEREQIALDSKLNQYNQTVVAWNEKGGAPPEEHERLRKTREKLAADRIELNQMNDQLNQLAGQINQVSERGNQIITEFNDQVGVYNSRFGQLREFTQGDYQGDKINIYQFSDKLELQLVIAHELGHALALNHVTGEASMMYHLMGGQSPSLQPTAEDLAEFTRVCGGGGTWSVIKSFLGYTIN